MTREEEREGAQNLYKWREAFFKDKFPYEVWVTTGGDDSHFGDTIPYQITRKVCHQLKQDNNDQWDQGSMQCLSPIVFFTRFQPNANGQIIFSLLVRHGDGTGSNQVGPRGWSILQI